MAAKAQAKVLSASQRAALMDEKRDLEATIRDAEAGEKTGNPRAGMIDKKHIEADISRLDQQIQSGTPGRITAGTRDKLAKRAEELRKEILVGMPKYDQMMKPARYPGIVRKNVEWTKRTGKACEEYKQVMRKLEPDDPTASSVEAFRPK
jgi:uncharacterized short protein YbdD (DUF466 family)